MRSILNLAIFVLLVVALFPNGALAERQFIPRDKYPGPCACPKNKATDGRECGKRSAFCKCNGYEPLGCYDGDGDPKRRESIQLRVCGYICKYDSPSAQPDPPPKQAPPPKEAPPPKPLVYK
ncbi:MAG: hypothetical protein WB760_01325 [Xanthobacteraceae bacterium]